MTNTDFYIHPTAITDEGCQVGKGTKIWHFCHVMPEAIVGENCILGQNCFLGNKVRLGNGVKVQNNVSIYEGVVVEDDVFLGPSMVFTNVLRPRAFIEQKEGFLPTLVREGATIGANATIVCGITIGRFAFIAAGAVVKEDVPDYGLVAGVPGKLKGYVSRQGHRLDFDASGMARCPQTGERYKKVNKTVTLDTD